MLSRTLWQRMEGNLNRRSRQPVFVVSDRTGITAGTVTHTLLTQFPDIDFVQETLPFVDNGEKVQAAIDRINAAAAEYGVKPLVFTTFVEENLTSRLQRADAEVIDLLAPFIGRMEELLHRPSSHEPGHSHGMTDPDGYTRRIAAVNFTLRCDDGVSTRDYGRADLVLAGVSRSGKTPTCLYMALHFGFHAANYPLTEEDFERGELPPALLAHREKVFGLTIDPMRLQQIRRERRPDSRYADLQQCRREVQQAEALFRRYRIPFCDATNFSIEELGTTIRHRLELQSKFY